MTVDVKTVPTQRFPEDFYLASINKDQWDRLKEKDIVNTLVFTRYILPENICYLVGFLRVWEFEEKMFFLDAGDKINNTIEVNTPMYNVRIKCLRPMIEIDRCLR